MLLLLFVGGIPNTTLTHTASQEVAVYLCSPFCLLEDPTPWTPHHSLHDTHRHVPWQRYCPKVFLTEPLSCSVQMQQSIHSSQDLFGQQMSARQLSGFTHHWGAYYSPLAHRPLLARAAAFFHSLGWLSGRQSFCGFVATPGTSLKFLMHHSKVGSNSVMLPYTCLLQDSLLLQDDRRLKATFCGFSPTCHFAC